MFTQLDGIEVIPVAYMSERMQVRFPRSKKSRIRKKWRRDSRNWQDVPMDRCIMMGRRLYVHPARMQQLADELAGKARNRMEVLLMKEPQSLFTAPSIDFARNESATRTSRVFMDMPPIATAMTPRFVTAYS